MEQNTQLVTIVEKAGLVDDTKTMLSTAFNEYFGETQVWKEKANALVVTDESQTELMKDARTARLALVKVRTSVDKRHKELKADSLKFTQTLDLIKRTITSEIEEIESHLLEQEKFAERKQEERRLALKAEREKLLSSYEVATNFMDLGNMPEDKFNDLLNNSRLAYEAKISEAKRIEEERIAKEKKEAEEREAMRLENERLKKEAEERERAIAEERRIKAEQDKKEREEREALEKKEREEREAKEKKEREEAERKLREAREETERIAKELRERQEKEAAENAEKEREEQERLSMGDKELMDEVASEIEKLMSDRPFKSKKYTDQYSKVVSHLNTALETARR